MLSISKSIPFVSAGDTCHNLLRCKVMMLSEVYHLEEIKLFTCKKEVQIYTNGFDKAAAYEIERRKDYIHSITQSQSPHEYLGKRRRLTNRMKKIIASTFITLLLLSVLIIMAKG
jgi:hypothetical protein